MMQAVREESVTAAILCSSNGTDMPWFHTALKHAAALCLTSGRIKFIDANKPGAERMSPKFGTAFFYFGKDTGRFAAVFSRFGSIVAPYAHDIQSDIEAMTLEQVQAELKATAEGDAVRRQQLWRRIDVLAGRAYA